MTLRAAAVAAVKATGRRSRVRGALPPASPMVPGRSRTASHEALESAPPKGSNPVMWTVTGSPTASGTSVAQL